jgi:4'-phosphopantetheinyl transferase
MPPTASITGQLQLASDEVHGWCVSLDVPPETCGGLYATLSSDERDRSARLRFEPDRRRFIVAHGVLRELLGRYLRTDPGLIRFVYGASGKPELSPECGRRVKFNLSHSGGLALIAVAADVDVGIDLEYVRAQSDSTEIARHFFSVAEADHLNKLPSRFHAPAFFTCWTKKEAYVKACGEGLAMPLTNFSVPLTADPAPVSVEFHGRRWSLYSLQPAPGYVGALVIEGSGRRLREWHWHHKAPSTG